MMLYTERKIGCLSRNNAKTETVAPAAVFWYNNHNMGIEKKEEGVLYAG